jgi:hypothetical protein
MKYLTYQDIVEHLISASFGGPQDAEQKDIRTAAQRSYRELTTMRDWRYYNTQCRIKFNPKWTGSVTYSYQTNQFTLVTGDPFPLYAAGCNLRIENTVCRILTRNSNTVLTADPVIRPADDIYEPATATIYQNLYPLPDDFRNMDTPIDQFKWSHFTYVTPDDAYKIESAIDLQGPPNAWTVTKDPYSTSWAIKIIGYPQAVTMLDFTYRRSARPIRISGHEAASRQGTVSVSGTAVTGTGTAFTSAMVGSIIRFGSSTTVPDTLGSMNPYAGEAVITAVSSATALTIDTSQSFSGVKYLVTDIADMPDSMHNAMLSCSEYWLARMRGQKPDNAFAMFQRDLRLAMEGDQLTPLSGTPRTVYDTGNWRTPLQSDNYDGGRP